ncbi:hypothetical protein [Euzebya rosea]|uniref:hypothetical protein n=1 Tax=Euzebya rosea TaxID=2052804 RepID=UPI001300BC56|nr:hypothetical protein [Euzebya rosea]
MPSLPVKLIAVLALVVMAAVPVGADDDVLQPCTTSNPTITLAGESHTPDTPLEPLVGETSITFTVDLAGNPVTDTKANVDLFLTWDDEVSDFDMAIGEDGTYGTTVLDGPSEALLVTNATHCSTITVDILNFAGSPLATLNLATSAR